MFIAEMFTEAAQPQLVVIYPGRFQPFHLGHRDVFESLQAKYGRDNVYIATSNKTELPKSPFNFTDKTVLMHAAGVPNDRILEVKSPYILPPQFDPASTVFVVAVGAPDADRLKPGSYKKDGQPSYYQKFEDLSKCQTADKHGYVIIAAERKKVITINGQQYDASHGTENRALWNSIRGDAKARGEYLLQMYGRNDPEVGRILDKIPMNEDSISPHATDSASAIPGISEHIVKHGSQYRLLSKHGNKNLGTFPTKAAAQKHEREVQYFKHANENAVPQWTELGEELSIEDKMAIFEAYHIDGTLLESDDHTTEYFTGLDRFSSTPVKNKKYIVTPLMLIQNRIIPLNSDLIHATLVGKSGNQYLFVNDAGETIKFPSNQTSKHGMSHTFIFDNSKAYDNFRAELAIKFNVELPDDAIDEAYDHNAPFNAADFNRHMAQLRAREELRKTDPVKALVGDLIDKEHEKERLAKRKPADDSSLDINDPRHPGWGALHNPLGEDAAGVGVVSNSKDPRYVMATMGDQNDVDASTLPKMMQAYGLTRKLPKHKVKEAEQLLSRLTQLQEQLATLKARK
jgi:hypothetical protein